MSAKKPLRNGQLASPLTKRPSETEITWPTPELKKILGKVYDAFQKLDDPKVNADCRHDFVFHMTDWLDDLRRFSQLYDHPDAATRAEAASAVYGFLIHAVPHLMAAGHLLRGEALTHPFELPIDNPGNSG